METQPENSEPGPASVGHVLDGLLRQGCQTGLSELVSSSSCFNPSPDFIRFLSSIPNSPFRHTENHPVTLSQLEVSAIAQFMANSDLITSYLNSPLFVPRSLANVWSNSTVRTSCKKRKRLKSEAEQLPPMKKRSHIKVMGFNEEQSWNQMLMTMPSGSQNSHIQGIEAISSLLLPFAHKCWQPKNILFGPTMFSKLHSGQLGSQIENIEQPTMFSKLHSGQLGSQIENIEQMRNRMKGTSLSLDELGYLHKKKCVYDLSLQGRFPNIHNHMVSDEVTNSFPHPKLLFLEHTVDNFEERNADAIDGVTTINSRNICTLSVLEIDEMNAPQTNAENAVQVCESLTEDVNRKRKEFVLHELGRFRGHKEKHQAETIYRDVSCTVSEKTVAESNNVVMHVITPGEGRLQSQGTLLDHLVTSTSVFNSNQNDEKNDKRSVISPARETFKLPGNKLEQVRRDKDQALHKRKAKNNHVPNMNRRDKDQNSDKQIYNHDRNMDTKEKETSFVQKKKCHAEQKPFPNFESFIVEEEEGSGGYGTVYRARRKADGVTFAIKCPHVNANMNHVHNELKMLERLGGRNFVIKYEGSLKSGCTDCLVLEHVQHDRPELLRREISIVQLQWYGYCLFKAIAGLHKQAIVHRDVKPGNFLFSRKMNKGYLIDFNLALDMSKKHGTLDNSRARHNLNDHISPPPEKNRKLMNAKFPDIPNTNAGKVSKSFLPPDEKRRVGKAPVFADTSNKNNIKSQVAEVSGITSARDATSTRTPSAERLKEPLPRQGRKELLCLVQEALHGGNHKSVDVPTCKRKRVAAPRGDTDSKCFYPTPMPLYANGIANGSTGLPKDKADGKRRRDGPCAGTKGFKAPEVLFRSLHQGPKTDVWSAGVTLLYLMIGRTPFVGDNDQNIKDIAKLRGSEDLWEVAKIHNHELLFPQDLFDIKYLSPVKLEDWCAQTTRRPDFLEAIPRSLYDLVDKCLTVNPRQRISADEALRHEFFTPCHEALKRQRQQQDKGQP